VDDPYKYKDTYMSGNTSIGSNRTSRPCCPLTLPLLEMMRRCCFALCSRPCCGMQSQNSSKRMMHTTIFGVMAVSVIMVVAIDSNGDHHFPGRLSYWIPPYPSRRHRRSRRPCLQFNSCSLSHKPRGRRHTNRRTCCSLSGNYCYYSPPPYRPRTTQRRKLCQKCTPLAVMIALVVDCQRHRRQRKRRPISRHWHVPAKSRVGFA
jgi:hypothetical protein